jgi:hypothetical protein
MNCGLRIVDCGLSEDCLAIRNPQSAIRNLLRSYTHFAVLTLLFMLLPFLGCKDPEAATNTRAQQQSLKKSERGEALIDAAAAQLADLPSAVDTELRPPSVILSSSNSANGEDVLAIAIANPQNPGGPINIVGVPPPAQNGRFKSVGVRSGDILKYYIIEDETVDEERRAAGHARQLARELTINQVLDDNTLIIEGSLAEPILVPAKIEVWRHLDDRLEEINRQLLDYAQKQRPPLHWEPGPDRQVLIKIVEWLNQWLRQVEPKTDWKRDPLIDSLDEELLADERLKSMLGAPALATQVFDPGDGQLLQEAVWLRDISRWAQGDNFNDLARAVALFDWTIRNVQLAGDENAPPHRPWRTLVDGRGTANERAWIFALLCRQQSLNVVILEVRAESQPPASTQPPALSHPYYLPALVLDGQLYLFDTHLGLPLPGPNGEGVATLAQVQQDDAILRQLDLDDAPYPLTSDDFKTVVASVVASPFELSRQAMQLESKLTGDNRLVLTVVPSNVAEELKSVPTLSGVKLWDVPFRALHDQFSLGETERTKEALSFEPFAKRPLLWKARVRHFQGRRQRDAGSDEDSLDDHREAAQLYAKVRPPDAKIARVASVDERRVDTMAKMAATYWMGLLSFDEGKFDVAENWFRRVGAGHSDLPWSAGTRFNLARSLEAQNKFDEAIQLLEEDTSPQRHGNRLRARTLRKDADSEKSDDIEADNE